MDIETFLLEKFPGCARIQEYRKELADACNSFVTSSLADANFTNELCSGSDPRFWSRVSEALLYARLCKVGLHPVPVHSHSGGPDFLLIEKGRKIWIEVVCPEPYDVPSDWLTSTKFKKDTFIFYVQKRPLSTHHLRLHSIPSIC